MIELVFLLEERSAQAMLEQLLPRLGFDLPEIRYMVFEGKRDLEANIVKKIRAYRNREARFMVVRDLDSHPQCRQLKARLVNLCASATECPYLVRIFCTELETIYFAGLLAVERALTGVGRISRRQNERKFREPDRISSPSQELRALTGELYQKVNGSRLIGQHLDLTNPRSPSFVALVSGIRRLAA